MALATAFGFLAIISLISLLLGDDRQQPADPRDDLLVLMNLARR